MRIFKKVQMDSEVSLKFYSFYQNEKKIIINSFYKQQLKQTRMRRISLLLVSLIVLTIQTALAQSFSVKGTIVSADDNEPLIGATIRKRPNSGALWIWHFEK